MSKFGSGLFGHGPFGVGPPNLPLFEDGTSGFGINSFGDSPFGGLGSFAVIGAENIGLTHVGVTFSEVLAPDDDPDYDSVTDPANYTIEGLEIFSVSRDTVDSKSVILTTAPQTYQIYTLVVSSDITDQYGDPIAEELNSVSFTGYSTVASFGATAQSNRKVQLTFTTAMLNNSEFNDPTNYSIGDLNGNPIAVTSVVTEDGETTARCTLVLESDLVSERVYSILLSLTITTAAGFQVVPRTTTFKWVQKSLTVSIPIGSFTGEVTGGIFGTPQGLVFFSPSLGNDPAPNSSIEVDRVSVCTKTYDTYEFPERPDPTVLFTYSPGITGSVLGPFTPNSVLFATWDRLGETRMDFGQSETDTVPTPTDPEATATLQETWDPAYVSLLNNTNWHLFDGSPTAFITADNLAPIPAGSTVVIPLIP